MSRRFLLTGHTGFKGSWLSAVLANDGFSVSGLALNPKGPRDLFSLAEISGYLDQDYRVDVNDRDAIRRALKSSGADTVVHLAAQPLVTESYRNPLETFDTNVIGTVNVLDAASRAGSVDTVVVVTTDKVYRNTEVVRPFSVDDPLGGSDPYSASKAAAELAVNAWASSFPGMRIATARAGNVIGGGDFAKNRLAPDLAEALHQDGTLRLRYPNATRPWQHVLDCLNGYLCLVAFLSQLPRDTAQCTSWNFGPPSDSTLTVAQLVDAFSLAWGKRPEIEKDEPALKEAQHLALDSSTSHAKLDWTNFLSSSEAIQWTADWYRRYFDGESPRDLLEEQISIFRHFVHSPLT
jgi:CDP-glucose 4,6-dehydratase